MSARPELVLEISADEKRAMAVAAWRTILFAFVGALAIGWLMRRA